MLFVKCPDDYFHNEREYIYNVILNDFLGVEYKVEFEKCDDICIECDGKKILVDDTFFSMSPKDYLNIKSMPKEKMACWDCHNKEMADLFIDNTIPVIYGRKLENDDYIAVQPEQIRIGIDIFGSAFFMLTRYEELVCEERDYKDRFSAYSSVAYKNNFLERPIVNEYIEILKWALQNICPTLTFKRKTFTIIPTHDVDRPSVILDFKNSKYHYRRLLGDLLVRKSLRLAILRLKVLLAVYRYGYRYEWKYTFDYIMDKSEKRGLKSTFFFMANNSQEPDDGDYSIDDPNIVPLIKRVVARGHVVGLHPEYKSFNNEDLIKENVHRLCQILCDANIEMTGFGARQHYLRWSSDTWQYYENSGIKFDTTLSFVEHIGFRCGICYNYPVYNLKARKQLKLQEYPLIVMDRTALGDMGLSFAEAAERIIKLKDICKRYNGNFVILWHNDGFLDSRMRKLYDKVLDEKV